MMTASDVIRNTEMWINVYQEDIADAKLDIARKEGLIEAGTITIKELKQVE